MVNAEKTFAAIGESIENTRAVLKTEEVSLVQSMFMQIQ